MDDRLAVPVVDDAFEVDIAEPMSCLPGALGKPFPIIIGVAVGLAVWLDNAAGRDEKVVDAAPMDTPKVADGGAELLGNPGTVSMAEGVSNSVRIGGQNR